MRQLCIWSCCLTAGCGLNVKLNSTNITHGIHEQPFIHKTALTENVFHRVRRAQSLPILSCSVNRIQTVVYLLIWEIYVGFFYLKVETFDKVISIDRYLWSSHLNKQNRKTQASIYSVGFRWLLRPRALLCPPWAWTVATWPPVLCRPCDTAHDCVSIWIGTYWTHTHTHTELYTH